MPLRGGLYLLSLTLGNIPIIMVAAQVFGFMPPKMDKGEGAVGINVADPSRLLDMPYGTQEKSSRLLKERQNYPGSTASPSDIETVVESDKSSVGDHPAVSSVHTAEKQSNLDPSTSSGNKYITPNANSKADNDITSNIEHQHHPSNKISSDFDDYDEISYNEDILGFSYCSEESDVINYTHDQAVDINISPTVINANFTAKNRNNTPESDLETPHKGHPIENAVAGRTMNLTGNNGTRTVPIKAHKDADVLHPTQNPAHEVKVRTQFTEASPTISSSTVREEEFSAMKVLPRPRTSYEYLLQLTKEKSNTESEFIVRKPDYHFYHQAHPSAVSSEVHQMSQLYSPARNMCICCGPHSYCDTTVDPNVCVCNFGFKGHPPNCYKPGADEMLQTFRLLLPCTSNEHASSTDSPTTVQQPIESVVQENKDSASPKE